MVKPGNLYEHVCLQFVLCVRAFVRTGHFLPCNLIRAAVWLNLDLHILPQARWSFQWTNFCLSAFLTTSETRPPGRGDRPRKKTTKSEHCLWAHVTSHSWVVSLSFLIFVKSCFNVAQSSVSWFIYMSWVSRSCMWCKCISDVYRLRIGPQYVSWLVMAVQRVHESEQEMLFLQMKRLHINILEKIHAGYYLSISVFKQSQGTSYIVLIVHTVHIWRRYPSLQQPRVCFLFQIR